MLRDLLRGSSANAGALWIVVVASLGGCVLSTEATFYDARGDRRVGDAQGNIEGGAGDADAGPIRDVPSDLEVAASDDGTVTADVPDDQSVQTEAGTPDAIDVAVADRVAVDVVVAVDVAVADACVAAREICNGVDDDCDGAIDNVIVSCGIGACRRTASGCASPGTPATCVPGSPTTEACNGDDDDCNGVVDDNIPVTPCGLGACLVTPAAACVRGAPVACTPMLAAAVEVCGDGIDNDCNGVADDGCRCARYVAGGGTGTGLTPMSPMGSIQAAIDSLSTAGTRGTVCVAAIAIGGVCMPATFGENVIMVDGISVLGGFTPGTFTRTDSACVTIISSSASVGTFFGHGITNATALDRFTLVNSGNATLPSSLAAITLQGGGTITNNIITGGGAPTSIGMHFIAPPGSIGSALVSGNTIRGGSSVATRIVTNSIGVRVANITPSLIGNLLIEGGATNNISSNSIGIELTNAGATLVADNVRIAAGSSLNTTGIKVTGNPTGLLITRNSIHGGTAPGASRGIHLEACGSTSVVSIRNNARVFGGTSTASNGILVTGCTAAIDSNATIIGRNAGGGGDAFGVHCAGSLTNCVIRSNARVVGLDAPGSGANNGRGVWIDSNATALVRGNVSIQGCAGAANNCQGVHIETAGTVTVDGNRIEASNGTGWTNGVLTRQTNSIITNNLVLVDNGNGLTMDIRPLTGRIVEASFHSNTVIGQAASLVVRQTNLIVIDNEVDGAPPNGIIRNNIAACLGGSTSSGRAAVREAGAFADPRILEHNELFGCPILYFDNDGSRSLALISQVNGQPDLMISRNNVSVLPGFIGPTEYHLMATSLLIDQGVATGAPASDFDGNLRPVRRAWDIGFDEVTP